ncbi:MAG: hypothetical protein WBA46_19020 [Thermomicrobiales bacterium]
MRTPFAPRTAITPTFSRRQFTTGTLAAIGGIALAGSLPTGGRAQSMDPYTYIRTMPATTTLGQLPGAAPDANAPVNADNATWSTYIQLPIKEGQDFHFTCEFDSAWIILKAFQLEVPLQQQIDLVGIDEWIEPWYEERADGVVVWGGEVNDYYCGDYQTNFLARARGNAMKKVFEGSGLTATPVSDRAGIEKALGQGQPVFFKSTVDFLDWVPATWITPTDAQYPVVLGNDHALIVMGHNDQDVIIRDPLGPTSTNGTRPYQYRVTWERYLEVFAAQGNDGLAVGPARQAN